MSWVRDRELEDAIFEQLSRVAASTSPSSTSPSSSGPSSTGPLGAASARGRFEPHVTARHMKDRPLLVTSTLWLRAITHCSRTRMEQITSSGQAAGSTESACRSSP